MSDNQRGCIRNYFSNYSNVGGQMNVITMTGNPVDGFLITFFRPWMILANITLDSLPIPPANPNFPLSTINEPDPTTNAGFAPLFTMMFIAMMYADRDLSYGGGAVRYIDGNFCKYFELYLNEGQKPRNYYSFLFPPNTIQDFLILSSTIYTTGIPLDALNQLSKDILNISDKRLFGAPGTYSFSPPTNGGAGGEEQLTQCFADFQSFTNLAKFELNYANPTNIPLSQANTYLKAYIESSDDGTGGGPVVWGSTTDKYAGFIQPNYSLIVAGDPTAMIADFCNRLIEYITGDPGEPYANYTGNTLATWARFELNPAGSTPSCDLDTPGGFSVRSAINKNYNFGKLGFETPKFYGLKVNFFNAADTTPFWDILVALYGEQGGAPSFAVLELKSVE